MSGATLFRAGTAFSLIAIIVVLWLHWPIPELGIAADPATGGVLVVAGGSPAAQAGVLGGDRILHIYDYSWEEINTRLLLVPLPWSEGKPTPVRLQRGEAIVDLTLRAGRPELGIQIDKALRAFVALVCWTTGIVLAASPQATDPRLRWAAWFWVLLGTTLGLFQLVQIVSYVLMAVLLWFLTTILAPTAVMMHVWYPSRPIAVERRQRAKRWWFQSMLALQAVFLSLVLLGCTTTGLLDLLDVGVLIVFLGSFVLSAIILWRSYLETPIAHIRRQIRLIGMACIIVANVWAALLLGGLIAPTLVAQLPTVTPTVVAVLIPLAYLLGAFSTDLLQLDRLARRIGAHACTVVVVLALLALAQQFKLLAPAPLVVAGVVLVGYRPVYQVVRRLGAFRSAAERPYEELSRTTVRLGTTLDAGQLAVILTEGLRNAYGDLSVAVYVRRRPPPSNLELASAWRLSLPETVWTTFIDGIFAPDEMLLSIGTVQQRAGQHSLESSDGALVFAPLVRLWGVVRAANEDVLALVVLGPRGDLDPYREPDLNELRRLLSAAALAFTNSASYERQVEAEQLIRRLYRRLQQVQDQTASAIAREIHDEVLNVNVRLNIMALERLISRAQSGAPEMEEELQELLESEQTTGTLLRLICEQLLPVDASDPLGLASSLRRTVEQAAANWKGQVRVEVENIPVMVGRQVHRELVRIAREAVTNAIKHARASEIVVALRFPEQPEGCLELSVHDNGPTWRQIRPTRGHLGLHFMEESAAAIGAHISWQSLPSGGTAVEVIAPASAQPKVPFSETAEAWWTAGLLAGREVRRDDEQPAGDVEGELL